MWFVYGILGILAFVLLVAAVLSHPRFDHLMNKNRPPPGMTHRD